MSDRDITIASVELGTGVELRVVLPENGHTLAYRLFLDGVGTDENMPNKRMLVTRTVELSTQDVLALSAIANAHGLNRRGS